MILKSRSHSNFRWTSLRAKFVLGIALPILLVMSLLSGIHYWRERQVLEDQIRSFTVQMGEVLVGSLRYGMLTHDRELLAATLANVGEMEEILEVQIIDLDNRVSLDSSVSNVGELRSLDDEDCRECHQLPPETRPRVSYLVRSPNVIRISTPIENEAECFDCHPEENAHLGVVLADVSLVDIKEHLITDLRINLLITVCSMILVTLAVYLLLHRVVVRRMTALRDPLAKLVSGNLSVRLPVSSGRPDELDRFAASLNQLADNLERHTHEREERDYLRQQAIVEERERIARELHDGLAQLLGYISTKIMAVRLMLKKNQIETANQHLLQIEEAARELFTDVREAILSLRTAGQSNSIGLTTALKDVTDQFNQLSGLPVELSIDPAVDNISLSGEKRLHLVRIVQEALTNVRKHASASKACLGVQIDGSLLTVMIKDNGQGFSLDQVRTNSYEHFGLDSMRERADAIGALFDLSSAAETGTQIKVQLPLEN